jgi:hypothetical protein
VLFLCAVGLRRDVRRPADLDRAIEVDLVLGGTVEVDLVPRTGARGDEERATQCVRDDVGELVGGLLGATAFDEKPEGIEIDGVYMHLAEQCFQRGFGQLLCCHGYSFERGYIHWSVKHVYYTNFNCLCQTYTIQNKVTNEVY